MNIEINNQTKAIINQKRIKQIVSLVAKKLKINKDISVAIVSSAVIKKLNHQYRDVNQITDILSFAYKDDKLLGELVICIDEIKREAKELNISRTEMVNILLVHGLLHLLGYEHQTQEQITIMERLEKEIYEYLNTKTLKHKNTENTKTFYFLI